MCTASFYFTVLGWWDYLFILRESACLREKMKQRDIFRFRFSFFLRDDTDAFVVSLQTLLSRVVMDSMTRILVLDYY